MSKDAMNVVIDFCAAWDRSDSDGVFDRLAPGVLYQNVPLPAMHGKDEAAKFLMPILRNTNKIEFRLLSLAVSPSGDEVLTERIDRLHFAGGVVDIPLMGIFKVEDGQIVEWRDYADNGSVMASFAEAGVDVSTFS